MNEVTAVRLAVGVRKCLFRKRARRPSLYIRRRWPSVATASVCRYAGQEGQSRAGRRGLPPQGAGLLHRPGRARTGLWPAQLEPDSGPQTPRERNLTPYYRAARKCLSDKGLRADVPAGCPAQRRQGGVAP